MEGWHIVLWLPWWTTRGEHFVVPCFWCAGQAELCWLSSPRLVPCSLVLKWVHREVHLSSFFPSGLQPCATSPKISPPERRKAECAPALKDLLEILWPPSLCRCQLSQGKEGQEANIHQGRHGQQKEQHCCPSCLGGPFRSTHFGPRERCERVHLLLYL